MATQFDQKQQAEVDETSIPDLVDSAGDAEYEIEKIKAKIKRLQEQQREHRVAVDRLQDAVNAVFSDRDPDEVVRVEGRRYRLEVRPMGRSRRVRDPREVHAILGDDTFYDVISVPLKAVDDYLTPEERSNVLEELRGPRGIKITKR